MAYIDHFFHVLLQSAGSDLHLAQGQPPKIRRHGEILPIREESLTYERSRDDMSSSKERPGAVHDREGEECPRCGDKIRAVSYSSYTVNYCPTCQTGGKVLADNTTSKFLK